MQISTFPLTNHDLDLLHNSEFLLRKNRVMYDIVHYLGHTGNALMVEETMQWLFQQLPSCKVTRGEQYKGLPYVVLDIPRLPSGDFAALRTVFWWGYGWNINLLVQGADIVQRWLADLNNREVGPVWVKCNDLWDNDHRAGGYTEIKDKAALREYLSEAGEVKSLRLLRYLPIEDGKHLPEAIVSMADDWKPGK